MGTKYSQQSATGYNASPPPDDGSQTEANKTKWEQVKGKIGDPVKTLAENIDAALRTHFDEGPDTKSTAYTTTDSDFGKVIEVSSGAPITLRSASNAGAGYRVTVKNTASSVVRVDVASSGTIDGNSMVALGKGEVATFMVNAGAGEYMELSSRERTGKTTPWPFSSADSGWIFPNGETIGDSGSGADNEGSYFEALFEKIKAEGSAWGNAGTEDFSNGDTITLPDFRDRALIGTAAMGASDASRVDNNSTGLGDTGGEDQHTLTVGEMPTHNHRLEVRNSQADTGNPDGTLLAGSTGNGNAMYRSSSNPDSTLDNASITDAGSGSAHNNMQPFAACNFVMKI